MRILFLEWKSFGNEDMKDAFKILGHEVISFPFSNKEEVHTDPTIEGNLIAKIQEHTPAFVFSFNYFPIISNACKKAGCKYVSWIYDSPYVLMYSYTINNPCNYCFVFDKAQYQEFHANGINTVYYLPLAANTKRLSKMLGIDVNTGTDTCEVSVGTDNTKSSLASNWKHFRNSPYANMHDIAFIGSLYTEKHQFYDRLSGISPYTRGYLEGIMASQRQVYGYNFIEEVLPPAILEDMHKSLPMEPDSTSVNSQEYLFAQYVINRQITAMERQDYLSAVAKEFSMDLYTPNETLSMEGCTNHGPVDYYDMAPYVFKTAKINLNISLRSIHTGIPLRCFDILGAGGFLLTNYQADFDDCYVAGEDYVYFENKNDLFEKIQYYLTHEEERATIAKNGFLRTKENHTYEHRIQEMLEIVLD